jgi:hypothetical protein
VETYKGVAQQIAVFPACSLSFLELTCIVASRLAGTTISDFLSFPFFWLCDFLHPKAFNSVPCIIKMMIYASSTSCNSISHEHKDLNKRESMKSSI